MDVKMGNYYQKYLIAFLSKRYQENVKILINTYQICSYWSIRRQLQTSCCSCFYSLIKSYWHEIISMKLDFEIQF